jgi:hypothetical protein
MVMDSLMTTTDGANVCQLCGAHEGEPYHDPSTARETVVLTDHKGRQMCQPCCEGTLEMEDPTGYLLAKATHLQAEFWRALAALETKLGIKIDGTQELAGMTTEDLKEQVANDDEEAKS